MSAGLIIKNGLERSINHGVILADLVWCGPVPDLELYAGIWAGACRSKSLLVQLEEEPDDATIASRKNSRAGLQYQFITGPGIPHPAGSAPEFAHAYAAAGAKHRMVQGTEFAAREQGYLRIAPAGYIGASASTAITTVIQGWLVLSQARRARAERAVPLK